MAYRNARYTPRAESIKILDRAWVHVQSVSYTVTARWLFYRLLQDGLYKSKEDYKATFLPLMSRARHNNFGPWRPDTLADDMRRPIDRAGGNRSIDDWAAGVARYGIRCELDHWYTQDYYIELWFEAAAMVRQFEYYTEGITLRPFNGMPSIDYKYQTAKALEAAADRYRKPVVILYFGDYDKAGLGIPETTVGDIRGWCTAPFEFERAGLNEGDAARYRIPENFEKPGTYQWEALADDAARTLITGTVAKYVDDTRRRAALAEGKRAERACLDYLGNLRAFMQSWRNAAAPAA